MHRARARALREIDPRRHLNGQPCRMFAHVTYVEQRGTAGFVCGTAMSGRQSIAFDSYSLQQGANGLYIGPVYLKGCGSKRHAGIVHKNAVLYGWVVLSSPGCFRFATAIVAPELHYFWMNLTRGSAFLCSTSKQLMLEADDGGEPYADLFALALVFAEDCRPVLHQCFVQTKRPPVFAHLRLQTTDPIKFIVAACMLSFSAEPFKQLTSLLRARQAEVDPSAVSSLQQQHLTPAALQQVIAIHKQQALQRLRTAQGIYRHRHGQQEENQQENQQHSQQHSQPCNESLAGRRTNGTNGINGTNGTNVDSCFKKNKEQQHENDNDNDDDDNIYPESPGVFSDDETAFDALLSKQP